MAEISPLRRRMIEDMTVRNLSPATQQFYIHERCCANQMQLICTDILEVQPVGRTAEVTAELGDRVGRTSTRWYVPCGSSTVPRWGRADALERTVAAREPQRLTVVLSSDEIVRFLEAVPGLRNRVALTTAYGAGLRVGEVARLEPAAIDSSGMLIRIEQGKGGKDRYVMLSPQLLQILRTYWRLARPGRWLFPGQDPRN